MAMTMGKGKGNDNGKGEGKREGGRVENPCILPVHKRREKKSSLRRRGEEDLLDGVQ